MEIKITSKHDVDISPAIEEYARKKLEKFPRFYDRIQQVELIVDKGRKDFVLEVITDVEHHDPIVASSEDIDVYAGIDQVVDRSIRQLKDFKSKQRDSKHTTPSSGSERT